MHKRGAGRIAYITCCPDSHCHKINVNMVDMVDAYFSNITLSKSITYYFQHGISQHQYADDTQLFVAVSPWESADGIIRLEKCLIELQAWFLGKMQRIAFRLLLSTCVCVSVCVLPHLWTPGKRFEVETSFFLNCAE